MIVCQCNGLTDTQILATLDSEMLSMPRSPVQAYRCLGCAPDCGRCLVTVRDLLRDARSACAPGCAVCPGHAGASPANDRRRGPVPLDAAIGL